MTSFAWLLCGLQLKLVYDELDKVEKDSGRRVDLVLCCGDLVAARNLNDLSNVAGLNKVHNLKDFYKYYSGEQKVRVVVWRCDFAGTQPLASLCSAGSHFDHFHRWQSRGIQPLARAVLWWLGCSQQYVMFAFACSSEVGVSLIPLLCFCAFTVEQCISWVMLRSCALVDCASPVFRASTNTMTSPKVSHNASCALALWSGDSCPPAFALLCCVVLQVTSSAFRSMKTPNARCFTRASSNCGK